MQLGAGRLTDKEARDCKGSAMIKGRNINKMQFKDRALDMGRWEAGVIRKEKRRVRIVSVAGVEGRMIA